MWNGTPRRSRIVRKLTWQGVLDYVTDARVTSVVNKEASGLFAELVRRRTGFIARTPLCFGFLSGMIRRDTVFPAGDHRLGWSRAQIENWIDGASDLLQAVAASPGAEGARSALRFCLSFAAVSSVIPAVNRCSDWNPKFWCSIRKIPRTSNPVPTSRNNANAISEVTSNCRNRLRFGPPEYTALLTMGLLVLSYMSGGSMLKTLAMATVGLLLGVIGIDAMSGYTRFSYGQTELADGIGFVTVSLGLFGIAEIMRNLEQTMGKPALQPLTSLWPTRTGV